jgi:hypothetical protein
MRVSKAIIQIQIILKQNDKTKLPGKDIVPDFVEFHWKV